MEQNENGFSPIPITSVQELLNCEPVIVERVNKLLNGGRLLLVNPQRLMLDIRLELTADAMKEWKLTYPEFFLSTGLEHVYDVIAKSHPSNGITVKIKKIFRRKEL